MKSQVYNKDELYPEDFTDDDKLEFDVLLEQAKILFPKLANDVWLIKQGIIAYLRKQKRGETEPPSQEEINILKILSFILNQLNLLKIKRYQLKIGRAHV